MNQPKHSSYINNWVNDDNLVGYIWQRLQEPSSGVSQKTNGRWTEPRLTTWFSEAGVSYTYSGIEQPSFGWPDWVEYLAERLSHFQQGRYKKPNSLLVNVYRHGNDFCSPHKDDETIFDPSQPIFSISLGGTRLLTVGSSRDKVEFTCTLTNGSLLIMLPGFQEKYFHGIPKDPGNSQARINLTFRYVKPDESPKDVISEGNSIAYIGAYAGIGARKTPPEILPYMADQARILQDKGLILRTGDAQGADKAFRDAVQHKEVYTPDQPIEQWAHQEVSVVCDIEYDRMRNSTRNLLARNMYQVFGDGAHKHTKQPSMFVLYWSLPSPEWDADSHYNNYYNCSGGTRYAVRAACNAGIPTFNLYNQMQQWEAYRDNGFTHREEKNLESPEEDLSLEPERPERKKSSWGVSEEIIQAVLSELKSK